MPRHISVIDKSAQDALEKIDTWPGEFRVTDVIKLTTTPLGLNDTEKQVGQKRMIELGTKKLIVRKYQGQGYEKILRRAIYDRINEHLRGARDQYGLRKYICYQLEGQKLRHWLKLDNLSLSTLDFLTRDRTALVEQMGSICKYLLAAQEKMIATGRSDITFGDVKAEVIEELAS